MDRREQPRQSSLPISLHPHIVTRPHPRTPRPGSSSSSQIGHVQLGETGGEEGTFDDSQYQLRPFAPSLSPATFDDNSQRTSGAYLRHGAESLEPDNTFGEDGGGRTSIPLPRRTNRRPAGRSSIPHGLPSIGTIFNSQSIPYAYVLPVYNPQPPPPAPERTPPPPWQEGEAGPSSLSRSRPDQGHQSRRNESRSLTQTETSARERIQPSPLGFRTFEWEIGQTDRTNRADTVARRAYVAERPEVGFGEYPGRGGTASAQCAKVTPDRNYPRHVGQYHDAQRHHSLPSEFVPGEHRNLFPSNRAEDETFEASYQGLGDIFSGDGDDLPPPYPQSVTSLLLPVKKEVEESSNQQPIQDDDDAIPKKKARKKAVVACNFCQKRKLRCSTDKPKCSNCAQRTLECVYGLPKRRGPGKARGSRLKRMAARAPEGAPQPPPVGFPGVHFRPEIPAFTYPYPPHPPSAFTRPVWTLAPLDTGSSRSGATPPPYTPSPGHTSMTLEPASPNQSEDVSKDTQTQTRRPGKRQRSETE